MNQRSFVIVVVVILCLAIAYCYVRTLTTGPLPLRLGYVLASSNVPYWVAVEKGFLKEEGLNVSLVLFASTPKIVEAASAGSIDGGYAPLYVAANALLGGVDLRIVTDTGHSDRDHEGGFIVVGRNSGIASVGDLKGKRMAIFSWGGMAEMVVRILLKRNSLTMDDVSMTIMAGDKQLEALTSGRLDAAYLTEPYLTIALNTGDYVKLSPTIGSMFPDHRFQSGTTFFMKSFIDEHKESVKAFMRAHAKAVEWMDGNPDETRLIIAKYTGLEADLVERFHAEAYSAQLDRELVDRCLSLMWEEGLLRGQVNSDDLQYEP